MKLPLKLPQSPVVWFTRLRLALMRHEELTGLVFWAALIGIAGALASVLFREGIRFFEFVLTRRAGSLVQVATSLPVWARAVIPALGGLIAGLILHYGQIALRARRNVDYMEAVVVGNGVVNARPTLLRSLSSLFTIASGGSIGREGPMVQLAALIGSKLGKLVGAPVPRLRLMVACGAAAGIAAAYNAPIAGALFVAEIVMGSIAMESFGPLLVSAVTANVTIHQLLGYGPVFEAPQFQLVSNWELFFYAVLGGVLGHLAPPFLALLQWSKQQFASLAVPNYVVMLCGGLMVGAISAYIPQVWGNGYSVVDDILHGNLFGWMLVWVLIAKLCSTAATVGSGAVGGVFTPTLFVGAAIGALSGNVLHHLLPTIAAGGGAYALVGMGGFLAATTHAPLMSILMIFEMTLDYQVVLPLMLACVTAHYTAKVYRRGESIYHDSLHGETSLTSAGEAWHPLVVGALLKSCAAVVQRDAPLRKVLNELPKRPVDGVYVVNTDNELVAFADPHRLLAAVKSGQVSAEAEVGSVAAPVTYSLRADMPLGAALDVFLQAKALTLPVTAGQWQATLLGQVSRHDLLLAIQDQLPRQST